VSSTLFNMASVEAQIAELESDISMLQSQVRCGGQCLVS